MQYNVTIGQHGPGELTVSANSYRAAIDKAAALGGYSVAGITHLYSHKGCRHFHARHITKSAHDFEGREVEEVQSKSHIFVDAYPH